MELQWSHNITSHNITTLSLLCSPNAAATRALLVTLLQAYLTQQAMAQRVPHDMRAQRYRWSQLFVRCERARPVILANLLSPHRTPSRLLDQNLHVKKAPQVMHMCIKVWVRVVVSVMVVFCLHIRNIRRILKNVLTPRVTISRVSHSISLEESQAWIYVGYAGSSQRFCMATAIC